MLKVCWNDQIEKGHSSVDHMRKPELRMPVLRKKILATGDEQLVADVSTLHKSIWRVTRARINGRMTQCLMAHNFLNSNGSRIDAAVTDVQNRNRLSTS